MIKSYNPHATANGGCAIRAGGPVGVEITIAEQWDRCTQLVIDLGGQGTDFYENKGVKGSEVRPALRRPPRDVREGHLDLVVAETYTRLAASFPLWLSVWEKLKAAGVGIETVDDLLPPPTTPRQHNRAAYLATFKSVGSTVRQRKFSNNNNTDHP